MAGSEEHESEVVFAEEEEYGNDDNDFGGVDNDEWDEMRCLFVYSFICLFVYLRDFLGEFLRKAVIEIFWLKDKKN